MGRESCERQRQLEHLQGLLFRGEISREEFIRRWESMTDGDYYDAMSEADLIEE